MTLFRKSKTRRPRKPAWIIARAALVAAALFFAALAVIYWGKPLWTASPVLAVFVAGGFAVSAIVTPAVVPKLAHAKRGAFAGLAVVCVAFGAVDSVGLAGALRGIERDMTQPAYDAALAARQADRVRLAAALTAAQERLDAVPLPNASGQIRQASTYETVITPLRADRDAAKAELDAFDASPAPERADVFDDQLVVALAALIQIALAVGMLALEATRCHVHRVALEQYEARLPSRRRKPKAQDNGPRLVAAND